MPPTELALSKARALHPNATHETINELATFLQKAMDEEMMQKQSKDILGELNILANGVMKALPVMPYYRYNLDEAQQSVLYSYDEENESIEYYLAVSCGERGEVICREIFNFNMPFAAPEFQTTTDPKTGRVRLAQWHRWAYGELVHKNVAGINSDGKVSIKGKALSVYAGSPLKCLIDQRQKDSHLLRPSDFELKYSKKRKRENSFEAKFHEHYYIERLPKRKALAIRVIGPARENGLLSIAARCDVQSAKPADVCKQIEDILVKSGIDRADIPAEKTKSDGYATYRCIYAKAAPQAPAPLAPVVQAPVVQAPVVQAPQGQPPDIFGTHSGRWPLQQERKTPLSVPQHSSAVSGDPVVER